LCHYDVNLTYPQNGLIPDVPVVFPTQRTIPFFKKARKNFFKELKRRIVDMPKTLMKRDIKERQEAKELWKRDLSLRANGTLDPWVCFLALWST